MIFWTHGYVKQLSSVNRCWAMRVFIKHVFCSWALFLHVWKLRFSLFWKKLGKKLSSILRWKKFTSLYVPRKLVFHNCNHVYQIVSILWNVKSRRLFKMRKSAIFPIFCKLISFEVSFRLSWNLECLLISTFTTRYYELKSLFHLKKIDSPIYI